MLWYYKYADKNMWIGNFVLWRGGMNMKRQIGRALSWVLLGLLLLIVVPVGAVLFVVSGVWSAVDRALLKFSRG